LDLADAKEGAARSRRLRVAAIRPPKPRRFKEREAGIVWWQDFMARMAFIVLCEMLATCLDAANVIEKGNSLRLFVQFYRP
jgi:hypothetical protein